MIWVYLFAIIFPIAFIILAIFWIYREANTRSNGERFPAKIVKSNGWWGLSWLVTYVHEGKPREAVVSPRGRFAAFLCPFLFKEGHETEIICFPKKTEPTRVYFRRYHEWIELVIIIVLMSCLIFLISTQLIKEIGHLR